MQKTIRAVSWASYVSGLVHLCFLVRRLVCRRYGIYILSYHHVVPDAGTSRHDVTTSQLDAHLAFVKKWFRIISLDEAVVLLAGAPLDHDYLVITFDDGYEDNYERALPLLRRHAVPATIFLIAGLIGSDATPWYDACRVYFPLLSLVDLSGADSAVRPLMTKLVTVMTGRGVLERRLDRALSVMKSAAPEARAAILELLRQRHGRAEEHDEIRRFRLMRWDHVREMARHGVSFGCHTMTHPMLPALSVAQIETEIRQSRAVIEQRLGTGCRTFAFPNGDFDDRSGDVLRALGFRAACTQVFGANRPGADPFRLRRIGVGRASRYLLAAKLSGLFAPIYALRKWLGTLRRRAGSLPGFVSVPATDFPRSESR